MTRFPAYAGAAVALLMILSVSCSEQEMQETPEAGLNMITLQIGKPFLETKATERGEEDLNENKVFRADFFFYPDGKTDQNAVLTAIGRTVEKKASADSTVWVAKVYCTDAEKTSLFGSGSSGTCQVFVVANNTGSYGEDTDLASLKATLVQQDFPSASEDGTPGKQKGLVMYSSGTDAVALNGSSTAEIATGRIEAFRSVAKMRLYFRMGLEVATEGAHAGEYYFEQDGVRYYPVLTGEYKPFVEFSNTVTKGRVNGSYSPEDADYSDYAYAQRLSVSQLTTPLTYNGKSFDFVQDVPFYSFPQVWSDFSEHQPRIILHIRWKRDGQTDAQGEWIEYFISPNAGNVLERNHYYRTLAEINSLGWGIDNEPVELDCSYVISPWISEGGTGEALAPGLEKYKYLVVDQNEKTIYNQESVKFTYASSSLLDMGGLSRVMAVRFYDYVMSSAGRQEYTYTSPAWSRSNSGMVWTNTITHTQTVGGTPTGVTRTETVVLDLSESGVVKVTHPLSGRYVAYEIEVQLKNNDGLTQTLTITQYPAIYVETFPGGNVFVNGYFADVTFPAGTTPSDYTDNNGTPLAWVAVPDGSGGYQSASSNGKTKRCIGYTDFYKPEDYAGDYMDFAVQKAYFQTGIITHYGTLVSKTTFDSKYSGRGDIIKVNVTAFDSSNYSYTATHSDTGTETRAFRIGDPRVGSGYDDTSLQEYLYNMHAGYTYLYNGTNTSIANASYVQLSSSVSTNLQTHKFSYANIDRNTHGVEDYSTRIPQYRNGHESFTIADNRRYIDLNPANGVAVETYHDYYNSSSNTTRVAGDYWMNSTNTNRLDGSTTVLGRSGRSYYTDYQIYRYYNSGWSYPTSEYVYLFELWYGDFEEWYDAITVSDIKIATTDHDDSNMIAPEFLVGSAWGAESGNVAIDFEQAQKRCATYQEQGYPAGRWRLPTEAELMFCIHRQKEGVIPVTFDLNEGNWASSGYYLYDSGSGEQFYPHTHATYGEEVAFLRCVYDSWYWGSEPLSNEAVYTYTPAPTK